MKPLFGLEDTAGRRWDRLLWGVHFSSGHISEDAPMLIGSLWAADMLGTPYPGEPTRALLFRTRREARAWCAETLIKWRDGRQRDAIVMRWMVRPVRVRETVRVEAGRELSTTSMSGPYRPAQRSEDGPDHRGR